MIGLIGAMSLEVEGLIARMENVRCETLAGMRFTCGQLFGHEAVLAVCGPGKVNAALCAQALILRWQPEWLLNVGVAGSGREGIGIGDLVIATSAVQHDMDTTPLGDPPGFVSGVNLVDFPCDGRLREALKKAAATVKGLRVHEGRIATGDQFINGSEQRGRIRRLFDAAAVEMEGAAVAHACYAHGVRCGILRSISDEADGRSDVDYPTFSRAAAAHTQAVVEALLREGAAV